MIGIWDRICWSVSWLKIRMNNLILWCLTARRYHISYPSSTNTFTLRLCQRLSISIEIENVTVIAVIRISYDQFNTCLIANSKYSLHSWSAHLSSRAMVFTMEMMKMIMTQPPWWIFLNRHSQSHFIFQIKGFTYFFVCVETDIIVIWQGNKHQGNMTRIYHERFVPLPPDYSLSFKHHRVLIKWLFYTTTISQLLVIW